MKIDGAETRDGAQTAPVALLVGPRVAWHPRIRRELQKDGLQVVAAEWAWEALDICRFLGERLALVLIDERLPADDPQAVVLALHRLNPEITTLLVTKRRSAGARPAGTRPGA